MRGASKSARAALLSLALGCAACSDGCNCRRQKPVSAVVPDTGTGEGRVDISATGREPRAKLEVARFTGYGYRVFVTTEASLGIQGQMPLRMPTAQAVIQFTTVRGMANPIARQHGGREQRLIEERGIVEKLETQSSELPKQAVDQLNLSFKPLVGTTARQFVAEDGEVVEIRTELVGGAQPTPEQKSILDAAWDVQKKFPFRLPSEPIGPGARWRFSEPVELRGVRGIQVADMTMTALDDSTARIRIAIRHQAPRQEVPHPLDPRQTAMLEHYRGDGEGELTIDRTTALPLEARLATSASLRLSAFVDGAPQVLVVNAIVVTRARAVPISDAGAQPSPSTSGAEAEPPGSGAAQNPAPPAQSSAP